MIMLTACQPKLTKSQVTHTDSFLLHPMDRYQLLNSYTGNIQSQAAIDGDKSYKLVFTTNRSNAETRNAKCNRTTYNTHQLQFALARLAFALSILCLVTSLPTSFLSSFCRCGR